MDTVQSRPLAVLDMAAVADYFLGSLGGITVGLFKAPSANGPELDLADFVPTTFSGYAPVTLTAHLDGIDSDGNAISKFTPQAIFTATGVTPDTVNGWFIERTGGLALYAYGFFDAPISMAHNGDQIILNALLHNAFIADADVEFIAGP